MLIPRAMVGLYVASGVLVVAGFYGYFRASASYMGFNLPGFLLGTVFVGTMAMVPVLSTGIVLLGFYGLAELSRKLSREAIPPLLPPPSERQERVFAKAVLTHLLVMLLGGAMVPEGIILAQDYSFMRAVAAKQPTMQPGDTMWVGRPWPWEGSAVCYEHGRGYYTTD